jgi:peptidoglycan/LPS O-acetylase OafA/YrhL
VQARLPPSGNRLDGLDTLRASAIVLVFLYHYMVVVSHEPTFGFFSRIGWVGVDLFFVLSGYLIGNQLFGGVARGGRLSPGAFYARRFLRTLPAYYVVLALYFLFPVVMGGKPPPPLWTFLTFTQNYNLHPGTAFSHAWSLCIEEQFYLLLPLVVMLALRLGGPVRRGWWLLGALMLAAICTRSLLWLQYGREAVSDGYQPHVYYSSFCRFDELLPGVAVAMLKNFHGVAWQRLMAHGRSLFAGAVAACAAVLFAMDRWYWIDGYGFGFWMTSVGYTLLACSFALLTLAALSPSSPLHRRRVPGAAALAAWSYSIYLSHKALAVIVQRALEGFGIEGGSAVAAATITLACVAGGWLLYRGVERPFLRWRDRRVPSSFTGRGDMSPAPVDSPAPASTN